MYSLLMAKLQGNQVWLWWPGMLVNTAASCREEAALPAEITHLRKQTSPERPRDRAWWPLSPNVDAVQRGFSTQMVTP